MRPHDEFLELCAVSTSGDLSEEEQKRLKEHLDGCPECRRARREFEVAVDVGVPLLLDELSGLIAEPLSRIPGQAEQGMKRNLPPSETGANPAPAARRKLDNELAFAHRRGHRQAGANWNLVWASFAAALLLTFALGIYAYRIGTENGLEVARATAISSAAQVETLEQQISDADHAREIFRADLRERDQTITHLRRQAQ